MLNYYRRPLISLFQDLNNLRTNPRNTSLCFLIQEKLIRHICRIESRVRETKKISKTLNELIKNGRFPREEVIKLREKIQYYSSKKNLYGYLLTIFRDVGDGIAFIYLNKWDIKPLCIGKEQAGFISGKKGFRLELRIFRQMKAQGKICIFNDVTNSLRYGDITVPKYGFPFLVEAKSGRSSYNDRRSKRQSERSGQIVQYLLKDEAVGLYPELGGAVIHRKPLFNREKDHREKLTTLAERAVREKMNFSVKIEKGLCYQIVADGDGLEGWGKISKPGRWIGIFTNRYKKNKQGYYPFPLSIRNAEILFKFYAGECLITVFIDLEVIRQKLEKKNALVETYNKDGWILCLMDLDKGKKIMVSEYFLSRFAVEFLSLKWLIKEFILMLKR